MYGKDFIALGPDLFSKNPLSLEAWMHETVKVTVHVDQSTPKGKYTGLIHAKPWPDELLFLEVVVR
jgi:hypothetical protein